jgi:uncharacterized membrane protein YukC
MINAYFTFRLCAEIAGTIIGVVLFVIYVSFWLYANHKTNQEIKKRRRR